MIARKMNLLFVLVAVALCSCVPFRNFDADLNKYVGRKPGELDYPPMNILLSSSVTDGALMSEYSLNYLKKCRWVFISDVNDEKIMKWHYPDSDSEKACHQLLYSQP
jgi:hypothetical protein